MPAPLEFIGKKFGRLVVIEETDTYTSRRRHFLCRCECGKLTEVASNRLGNGMTRSCGCLSLDVLKARNTKHNSVKNIDGKRVATPEYTCWQRIKDRCYNRNAPAYKNYGGRGILMCSEWENDFSAFLADMGERPSKLYSIERIDNDKGYSKDNCKWATRTEQALNRRNTRWITFNGETRSLADWARYLGMPRLTLKTRLDRHKWTIEQALSTPVKSKATG